MADQIDLGVALDGIVASLAAQFPDCRLVAAEDESRTEIRTPAILVQISELEPDPDNSPHTGQFSCLVHVEARVVLGYRTPKVRREVLKLAGALATFVQDNRLGSEWGHAIVLAVEPDEFAPQADKFDLWRVEWVHSADLGETYFVDGDLVSEVYLSWSPDIGVPNEPAYERVDNMVDGND